MAKRKTKEDYIRILEDNANKENLSIVTDLESLDKLILSTKIKMKCPVCEKTRFAKVSSFIEYPECQYCRKVNINKNRESRRELAYSRFPKPSNGKNSPRRKISSKKVGPLKKGVNKANKKSSKPEQEIAQILCDLRVPYDTEVPIFINRHNKRPLRADFVVSLNNHKYYIEYDGEHHFHNYKGQRKLARTQMLDETKDRIIRGKKNSSLLRIPYWEKDNLEYWIRDFLGL